MYSVNSINDKINSDIFVQNYFFLSLTLIVDILLFLKFVNLFESIRT